MNRKLKMATFILVLACWLPQSRAQAPVPQLSSEYLENLTAVADEGYEAVFQRVPRLIGRQEDNVLEIEDLKHRIIYRFDVRSPAEQSLPQEYIRLLKKRSPEIQNLLKDISVSNIQIAPDGASLRGEFNIYGEWDYFLGKGTILVRAKFDSSLRSKCAYEYNTSILAPCVHFRLGSFRLEQVRTGLGSNMDQFAGFFGKLWSQVTLAGIELKSFLIKI